MTTANRVMWILIGLVLLAAGVVGVLVNLGHFPDTDNSATVMTNAMTTRWRHWGGWATAVLIVAALIVAGLGIALIRGELHRRGGRSLSEVVFAPESLARPGDPTGPTASAEADVTLAPGRTQVSGRTLRHALEHDLQNDPRIKHAAVRITGHMFKPQIHLNLDVIPGSDLPTVHASVTEALDRFRTTSHLQPALRETVINVA